MNYFLLAFLIGLVLRYVARAGTRKLLYISMTDEDLKRRKLFKLCVVLYILGSISMGFGGALYLAYTIKDYI
jgi:hypothetical protein